MNARVAAARLAGMAIDDASLLEHLATVVAPIVEQVSAVFAEHVDAVTSSLFDVSLELMAVGLLGPQVKHVWIPTAWRKILGASPALLAREPAALPACISNAVANLAAMPGTRVLEWIDAMQAIATACPNTSTLLQCGQALAWRSGMVQYRDSALEIAERLPNELAQATLGIPNRLAVEQIAKVITRLRQNRWLLPGQAASADDPSAELRIVGRVGSFRGFGGAFMRPPTVGADSAGLLVADGKSTWRLLADVYGSLLVRTDSPPMPRPTQGIDIAPNGLVQWNGDSATFAELSGARSYAIADETLAVALATSHQVYLLARVARQNNQECPCQRQPPTNRN